MRANKAQGFTLIELMVALIIMAIMLAVTIPSYQNYIATNRATLLTNQLINAFLYARSEAVENNQRVSVCALATANSSDCASSPASGQTANWALGWIIFTDGSTLGVRDGDDEVIRRFDDVPDNIAFAGEASQIVYNTTGFLGNSADGTFEVWLDSCYAGSAGRRVTLSTTGRPTVASIDCSELE